MLDVNAITTTWNQHAHVLNSITRPSTQDEYQDLLDLIEHITAGVDDLEHNPYDTLLDLLLAYVNDFETTFAPLDDDFVSPREVLAAMMLERGVTQKDLERANVMAQPLVSKVLKGEREISKSVARKLAAFFAVDISVFI